MENLNTPIDKSFDMEANPFAECVEANLVDNKIVKTLSFKLKHLSPRDRAFLEQGKREVNFIWNFLNETSFKAIKCFAGKAKFLSSFDMHKLTSGCTYHTTNNPHGLMILNNASVQCINTEYCNKRKQFKKLKLKWRKSSGSKANLGWIPFKQENLSISVNRLRLAGKGYLPEKIDFDSLAYKDKHPVTLKVLSHHFKVYNEAYLRYYLIHLESVVKNGTFSEDTLGDWWLNLTVEIHEDLYFEKHLKPNGFSAIAPDEMVGLDLGLDRVATTSKNRVIKTPKFYREKEEKLAKLQKHGRKKQAKYLHRDIKNQRNDFLHKESNQIVKEYQNIKVGDLNIKGLKRCHHGKSYSDQGLGYFKNFLSYKSRWAGRSYALVNESYSTQVCSNCDCICGPKGLKELGVRTWQCVSCGVVHDRDHNSALNMERISINSTLLKSVPRCWHPFAERNEASSSLQKGVKAS